MSSCTPKPPEGFRLVESGEVQQGDLIWLVYKSAWFPPAVLGGPVNWHTAVARPLPEEDAAAGPISITLIQVPAELSGADRAFLEAMAVGLTTARTKYPGNQDRFVALAGEAGEAFHAVQRIVTGRGTVQELGTELRQVAQMACRLAVEGDAMFAPEIRSQFPVIVQPDPTTKPHQPGHQG